MFRRVGMYCLALCALASGVDAAEPALVPRAMLFSHPIHTLPLLSPDGTRLAYLAPTKSGALGIWIRPVHVGEPGRLIIDGGAAGVVGYRWAEDDVHILYWRDADGDENWHLFAVDVLTGEIKDLTPIRGVKVQNLLLDPRHPKQILVGLNDRDPSVADMYRIDLDTGARVLDTQNPGDVMSWAADQDFSIRAATAFDPKTAATVLRVRDNVGAPWRDLTSWAFHDAIFLGQVNGGSVAPAFRSADTVLAVSTTGVDKSRLVAIDIHTGIERAIAQGSCPIAEDVGEMPGGVMPADYRPVILSNPDNGTTDAVVLDCADREWAVVNPAVAKDLTFLKGRVRGFPYVISRDRADRHWIIADLSGDRPNIYSLYDRTTHTLTRVFQEESPLASKPFVRPRPGTIKARDGLDIPIYLTRKPGAHPRPLLLVVHGGPWFRDRQDFDPSVQLFADRGYAVLQVQYRGSAGYGKAFMNAGDHEFGLKMRDDLIDAVEWAIHEKVAAPGRIGVFGASAGGYLALRVTEERPDLFRATVDLVGPTDLKYQMESMSKSSLPVMTRWLTRVGDVINDPSLNRRLSPHFDKPSPQNAFLIAQGANDPRVNRQNSDRLAANLRRKGIPVRYLLYLNEGHGFARPENNLDFYGRLEAFLSERLGGQAEPMIAQPGIKVEVK